MTQAQAQQIESSMAARMKDLVSGVRPRFGDGGGLLSLGIGIGKLFALSPEKGAETIIYLASSPAVADASVAVCSHRRKPPRKALILSPARQFLGSALSFFTLPPPSTT